MRKGASLCLNLCLDIGNSFTSIGLFKGQRLISFKSVNNNVIPFIVKKMAYNGIKSVKKCIISSVVPIISKKIEKILRLNPEITVVRIKSQLVSGIRIRYKNRRLLGADRAINAYGAHALVGGNCIIADFGTALTLDFVSKKGVFEGGVILPGLGTALTSLHEKTALLPAVSLKGPAPFPGRSTEECMRTGILQGFAAMTRGLVRDFEKRFRVKRCTLIVTGGHAEIIRPFLSGIGRVRFDPYFTLKSMNALLNLKRIIQTEA